MKTLVKNSVSIMIINDDVEVKMGKLIDVGGRYRIDNSDDNIVLYENIDPPSNYRGNFFCYNGNEWTPNLNWRPRPNLRTKVER